MAASKNQGFVRIGVFLSAVWMIAIAGFAYWEGQHPDGCALTLPSARECTPRFWAWERDTVVAEGTRDNPADPSEKRLKKAILNTLAVVMEEATPGVYRLQPDRVALWMLAPLALLWGFGFGISWVVQGFRQGSAKP